MEKTFWAMKMVMKALLMMLSASNAEAVWINKGISRWSKNSVWKGYWEFCTILAEKQRGAFRKMAETIKA